MLGGRILNQIEPSHNAKSIEWDHWDEQSPMPIRKKAMPFQFVKSIRGYALIIFGNELMIHQSNDLRHLTDYCRSVTIVTKTKTTFFTRKIDQFHLKTGQFRHFFEVKNVVNFSNSSRQYSVNGKAKAKRLLYLCW